MVRYRDLVELYSRTRTMYSVKNYYVQEWVKSVYIQK